MSDETRTWVMSKYSAAVQGVEVEPNNPHLFWSAAEDGTVRQYDLRIPSNSQKAWDSCNCLLSVKAVGSNAATRSVELKGISLNKVWPHKHIHLCCIGKNKFHAVSSDTASSSVELTGISLNKVWPHEHIHSCFL